MTEPAPNPYNRNKEWQDVEEPEFVSSDSLFRPTQTRQTQDPDEDIDPTSATQGEDDFHKKRYDELKRHHDRKVNELNQKIQEAEAAARAAVPAYTPPKTAEEISEFREKNPELFEVLESQIYNQTKETSETVEDLKARENRVKMLEAQQEIKRIHPDFEDIKTDPLFHAWAEEQDEAIQNWIYKNPYNGALAAKAITLYKLEKGIGNEDVTQETSDISEPDVDAATLLPTRSSGANTPPEKKVWKESEIAALSMRQYERLEDEIDLAIEEGRVVKG